MSTGVPSTVAANATPPAIRSAITTRAPSTSASATRSRPTARLAFTSTASPGRT